MCCKDLNLGLERMQGIISPFVDDDIAKMDEYEKDKKSYVRMIMDRDDFHSLSNYVYENQLIRGKYALQQIQETYRELIAKCYDWYFANKENEPLAE